MIFDTARAAMNRATARASSCFRNQWVIYRMMPGKNPASATPRMNRRKASWRASRCRGSDDHDDSPADEDAGNPYPGTDPLEDHVARDLEDEVADEEDARQEPEDLCRKAEGTIHLKGCIPEIHPVEERDDIEDKKERKQAAGYFPYGLFPGLFAAGSHAGDLCLGGCYALLVQPGASFPVAVPGTPPFYLQVLLKETK